MTVAGCTNGDALTSCLRKRSTSAGPARFAVSLRGTSGTRRQVRGTIQIPDAAREGAGG